MSVSPADPTLELLAAQISRHDIIIPFYQRRFVWTIEQSSKLVESFLMGLPVPQVFLYVNSESQLEVIDGQQRLLSVKYFFDGYFGEPDRSGRRQIFKLKNLAQRSEYNEKTFSELSSRDQRRLRNSTLRTINIRQLHPEGENESVFHIFERLNTGGTRLRPQEIRNAVYRGRIIDTLKDLNNTPEWQHILGLKRPDRYQKDIELILRLFGLFQRWQRYEKPMLSFLNKTMDTNRKFESPIARRFKKRFVEATKLIDKSLSKPFRPKTVVNSAVLDSVMIAILENGKITESMLKRNYKLLLADAEFRKNISGATTDTNVVQARIEIAKRVLSN